MNRVQLQGLVPVRQHFPRRGLLDVENAIRQELRQKATGSGLQAGSRIAIAVGSRGISALLPAVRATVSHFRDAGHQPFVIPAMGSHGGGTARGQAAVLEHFGITDESIGCPLVSSLDVAHLGSTPEGIDCVLDRTAFESDGVFLINRVKWHTTFEAPIESGLLKMAAIGLGKLEGAQEYHRNIVRLGFEHVIMSVARQVLATGKILGGLAIAEDAYHDVAAVVAMRAEEMEAEEAKLLALVKSWMPRLLFDEIDILLVEEIGKHISGVGMDSKVINRHPYGAVNPWPWAPKILRVYVRSLSASTYGNANGFGMADMISERLYRSIDWEPTKVNALTACNLPSIRTPLRAGSDLEAMTILGAAVGRRHTNEVTAMWIRNTLDLGTALVTENLLDAAPSGVERCGPTRHWNFDTDGNLPSFDTLLGAAAGA